MPTLLICTPCQTRLAEGFLNVQTSSGGHVACWPNCFHCADMDASELTDEGFLVSFLMPPSTVPRD